jgi:F-type H+-transporting ATPase subunit gamma
VASLKVIRKRIVSVRNTQQVTKAMKMVAAAKLRRAQESAENARAYAEKLTGLLTNLASAPGASAHPLMNAGADAPAHVIVVSADRGLCGGYNANVIRLAENFMASEKGAGSSLTVCGKRGHDYFRRREANIVSEHVDLSPATNLALARTVAEEAAARFLSGEAGAVFIAYTSFKSAISQQATLAQLLPVTAEGDGGDEPEASIDYVYEPDGATILNALLPRYIDTVVFQAILEASASEHGARMTAMDSASNNASDMIDRLTLQMNRARQASITTELMEIVSGAEALNG